MMDILSSWLPVANSKTFVMYKYRGTPLFLQNIVSSHITSNGYVAIAVKFSNKEAIGSSMETTCFLICELCLRHGCYKINNIYIKLNIIIHKYKLLITK